MRSNVPGSDPDLAMQRRVLLVATAVAFFGILAAPATRADVSTGVSQIILFVASPFAPDIGGFDDLPEATVVVAADGTEVGRLGSEHREHIPLDSIPEHVRHAVLAAEDARFYSHSGVSPAAIVRAALNNVTGGRVQGGSTITQQLAKINYTGGERTLLRKIRELLYAARLERTYSKDELLERYLNQVYFGQGAYGVQIAARSFYGVETSGLTVDQAATLAAKIRSPEGLDPRKDAEAVRVRRDAVLRSMEGQGWLSSEHRQAAEAAPLQVVPGGPAVDGTGIAPHFVRYVGREALTVDALSPDPEVRRRQLHGRGGFRIETTLDARMQNEAVEAVRENLGEPGDPATAVVSVVPGDGAIRALVSGLDPAQEFDVATQGRRQPGSAFKPLVYMAMLREGIDPRSTFDPTSPKTLDCRGEPWPVSNYEGEGSGPPMNMDDAMVASVNVVYAQMITEVGPRSVRDVAVDAGVAEDAVNPAVCAMALGGLKEGVSPLEMAGVYAAFAAEGRYAQPYAITRILDRGGQVLYEREDAEPDQVFEGDHVAVMNRALRGVVTDGTGRAASIGRPVAGKTGTTDSYTNAWFVGYVPQLATAVWVGRPEGDVPMTDVRGRSVSGGSYPAAIFGDYMRDALARVRPRDIRTMDPDALGLRIIGAQPTPTPSPT
ncbi:MAG TPA: transglycosylase domain-containing protein, partial [Actinomycetota bacterium]|nr:transglycosylase domain-containing protein [Actinomycetota bacterium]